MASALPLSRRADNETDDEMMRDNTAILAGAEPSAGSVNAVRDVPPGFSEWIKANETKIGAAKSLPYFIRDNKAVVDNILNPKTARSALGIVKENVVAGVPGQDAASKKAQFERKAVLHYGNSMLRIMGGVSDETRALAEAIEKEDVDTILQETRKLKEIGKQIMSVGYFKNPLALVREYSLKEIIPAARHLNEWCTREKWNTLTPYEKGMKLYGDWELSSRRGLSPFEQDLLWNELRPKSKLPMRRPWWVDPNPAADMRHSKRTQEYYEDIHRRWALREMRVKGWGDFKASTKTAAQELKDYKGTAKVFRELLSEALQFYNEHSRADERLSPDIVKKVISAQVKFLGKDNTIKLPGVRTFIQDRIFRLAPSRDLTTYPLPLFNEPRFFKEKVLSRASLAREDIKRLPCAETEPESIKKLAGGDLTEGSCASLAQAFVARRLGYDVVDYRGDVACDVHSSDRLCGYLSELGRFRAKSSEDVFNYIRGNMSVGEYYMLCTHQHAAIVKKAVGDKIFYLEMQTDAENGWHRLSGPATLADRFGDFSGVFSSQMICFTELAKHFDMLVGNLETIHNTGKQMKGVNGGRK